MKAYANYKESGVSQIGEIPSHWTTAGLKNLFRVVGGSTPQSGEASYWDGDIVWVTPADLSKLAGRGVSGSQRMITGAGLNACGSSLVPEGSLILSTRAPIGSLAVAEREMCTNQGCKALVPAKAIEPTFYYFVLSVSTEALNVRGRGTTFLELSGDALGSFPLPLPPLAEQQAIAAFLDRETAKLDALVEEQRRLIALLKEKRQAVISHAVTRGLDPTAPLKPSGIDWLGDIPAHWEVNKLSRLVRIAEGQVDPRVEPYASMPLIAPNHIESGTGRLLGIETAEEQGAESGKYQFSAGTVIYSKIRPALAKVVVAPVDGLCSADMYPLESRGNMTSGYLAWLLLSPGFTAWAILESDRVAMPKINREALSELRLPVPSVGEQAEIEKFLKVETERFDALTAEATRAIALLQERRAALISAAVTGKIDVPDATITRTPEEVA